MADRPRRRNGMNWVEIEGDVVVVDPATDGVHVLIGAAAVVWQLVDGDPIEGMAQLMVEQFGISLHVAATGLAEALAQLEAADVIEFLD